MQSLTTIQPDARQSMPVNLSLIEPQSESVQLPAKPVLVRRTQACACTQYSEQQLTTMLTQRQLARQGYRLVGYQGQTPIMKKTAASCPHCRANIHARLMLSTPVHLAA